MKHLLTKLKKIESSKDFQNRSLTLILNSRQNQPKTIWDSFLAVPHQKIAFGLTALAIFLILGGLSVLNSSLSSKTLVASLNQESLDAEAKSLDIQIQLSQVQYYQDSARRIEIALNQTSKDENNKAELDRLLDELAL